MKIYYINLARRADRRAFMEEQLARLGLAATRVEAVTPDDLTPAEIAAWCDPRRGHWLTPLELACATSHLRLFERALAEGHDYALILEDDVILSARLPSFLHAFARVPTGADLVHLEASQLPIRCLPSGDADIAGIALWRAFSLDFGTAAYIVSRRAMQQIIADRGVREKPIDHAIFDPCSSVIRGLVLRHAVPGLGLQSHHTGPLHETLGSDLGGRHMPGAFERRHFWRRLPYVLRVTVERHIVAAAQRAWYRYVHGARRQRIPFDPG